MVTFALGWLLQGQMRTAKRKSTYHLLSIGPRDLQYETNLKKIMGWESFAVFRFDLEPPSLPFQVKRGQPNLKVLITHLLLILEVCKVKPTYRISWTGNLRMWSDLTFGPSFKVKRWFTGFGELSFRWIQIYISSPICRSSLFILLDLKWFISHK